MSTPASDRTFVARLDAALPQTQCTRCGYPRCRAYAEALAQGTAAINQCPPGGDTTIATLAHLLGVPVEPLDPRYGAHQPRKRAAIDEARCIGCRKCIDACPTDAIVGARKWTHTIIAAQCTGCELCLPPCPVDCIDLVAVAAPADAGLWPDYSAAETAAWRARTQARWARLQRIERGARGADANDGNAQLAEAPPREAMRAEIRAARERVRAKRGSPQ